MMETHFLFRGNRFLLFNLFFLQVETVTEISGNPFLGEKTWFPLAERDFRSSENCFLLLRASFLQIKPLLKLVKTSSL